MTLRAAVLCPGRGSYTASELGYLQRPGPASARRPVEEALDRVDERRRRGGETPVRELDGADRFGSVHLRGHNASPLTFACSAYDFLRLDRDRLRVVAVGGNSLGWYSALYCAGVFDLPATFRLVETMGDLTRDGGVGGQIVYPVVDDEWRRDGEREAAVDGALAAVRAAGHRAGRSIRFGGFEVLWGDEAALGRLLKDLPVVETGSREYPFRLLEHAAFHSPLLKDVSRTALDELLDLPWGPPRIPLVDGRGEQWRPLTTDPDRLYRTTLGRQVVETFDFRATVRVVLREYAPDALVLLGPGDSLGAAVAQVIIEEGWQGIDARGAFLERQEREPFLLSLGRPDQARRVVREAGDGGDSDTLPGR